jgi:OPA family sugar phosphate sensor protein UhpC-like MFS transporter
VGSIVAVSGWQWGFFGAAIAGAIGIVIILFMMHDTPESKGLLSIEVLTGEKVEEKKADDSAGAAQRLALRTPAVWILALASAFMYISRYSLNSWGILFLQEEKGFSLESATFIISINALLGIVGTVLAGWMSDVLFKGDRKIPAFVSGIMLSISYIIFVYGGNEYWVNVAAMVLFGIAIGVLIAFLGGLMAIDVVPRKATGAALGIVGCASYIAAGIQDVVSGYLIDSGKTEILNELGEKVTQYDFSQAALFWIGASVVSFLLPVLNWGKKVKEE